MFKTVARLKLIPWWVWLFSINALFIFSTAVHYNFELTDSIHFYLRQINLAIEMNFAASWSGMLLFALALLAYEIFSDRGETNKSAWLFLAIAWMLLSLDEIGSIHERIEDWLLASPLPESLSTLDPYIPIAIVGILLIPWPLIRLFQTESTRKTAAILLSGFLLLASIALQERLEGHIDWGDWWGIRIAIEEGTELLGMFLCYCGLVNHTWRGGKAKGLSGVLPNPLQMSHLPLLALGGLVVHLAVSAALILTIESPFSEHTLVWYPLALSLTLSLSAFWRYRRSPNRLSDRLKARINSLGWMVLSALALGYCAIASYLLPLPSERADAFLSFYLYGFHLLLFGVVILLWVAFRGDFPKKYWPIWAMGLALALCSRYPSSVAVRYGLPSVFTFLWFQLFCLETFQQQKKRRSATRQRQLAEIYKSSQMK